MGEEDHQPGGAVPLNVTHQGNESVIADDKTALIGSDATSDVRIVRPGISRRHAVVSFDGSDWRIEDAGSRNGTFENGERVQTKMITGPTTLYLGHPTNGETVVLTPVVKEEAHVVEAAKPRAADVPAFVVTPPPPEPQKTIVQPASTASTVSDVGLAQLTAAMRDQISAVKGLTWSVWAMIAVTAVLIVLTLFVWILSN